MKAKKTEHIIYRRKDGASGRKSGARLCTPQAYDLKSAVLSTGSDSQQLCLRLSIISGVGEDTNVSHFDVIDCDIYKTLDGVLYGS